jgi:hypothetical protein
VLIQARNRFSFGLPPGGPFPNRQTSFEAKDELRWVPLPLMGQCHVYFQQKSNQFNYENFNIEICFEFRNTTLLNKA